MFDLFELFGWNIEAFVIKYICRGFSPPWLFFCKDILSKVSNSWLIFIVYQYALAFDSGCRGLRGLVVNLRSFELLNLFKWKKAITFFSYFCRFNFTIFYFWWMVLFGIPRMSATLPMVYNFSDINFHLSLDIWGLIG